MKDNKAVTAKKSVKRSVKRSAKLPSKARRVRKQVASVAGLPFEDSPVGGVGRGLVGLFEPYSLTSGELSSERFNKVLPTLRENLGKIFGVPIVEGEVSEDKYQDAVEKFFLLTVSMTATHPCNLKEEAERFIKTLRKLKSKIPQKRRVKPPNVLLAIRMRKKHKSWPTIKRAIYPDWRQMTEAEKSEFRKFQANIRAHGTKKKNTLSSKK
jgi:hypothetical protein